jgi:hypothetical protein
LFEPLTFVDEHEDEKLPWLLSFIEYGYVDDDDDDDIDEDDDWDDVDDAWVVFLESTNFGKIHEKILILDFLFML